MTNLLTRFEPGQLIGLVAVAGGLLCAVVAIVADYWHKIRRAETEAALKQDMLNRGMSAEEIRTVLEAGTKRSRRDSGGQRSLQSLSRKGDSHD
jgi:hypothetical protein